MNVNINKFKKKELIFSVNILFILSIWFCIDTNFENFFEVINNYSSWKDHDSFKKAFLFIRSVSPFFGLIIFCLSSLYFRKKIYFLTKNKNLNYMLVIFYIYFLFKFIGLLTSENDIYNSYYIFVSLISIFAIANIYNESFEKTNYLVFSFVISILVLFYGYLSYEWVLTTPNLNMYGTFPHVFYPLADFSSNVIRSSGLSRSAIIILIPLFFLILIDENKYFFFIPYSKLIYLIPYIILSTMIYLCQSRIVVIFLIMFSFFSVFFFLRDKTIKHKIQKFFILILVPIIFFNTLVLTKKEINKKSFQHIEKEVRPEYSVVRKTDNTTLTSHRYTNWKKLILNSKKPILGYGPLGDRYLIEQNAHNTLLYSYISGGIISTILILILILRYTYLCLFLTFIKQIPLEKKNIFILSSIFITSFILFRGIGEVGIGVFSIDLLVFLSCIAICEKFKIQK